MPSYFENSYAAIEYRLMETYGLDMREVLNRSGRKMAMAINFHLLCGTTDQVVEWVRRLDASTPTRPPE